MTRRAPGVPFLGALMSGAMAWVCPASACITTYTADIQRFQRERDTGALETLMREIAESHRHAPTIENTNDLAVAWILSGRVPQGIELLRGLEQRSSGNAIVAANLGTALEIAGDEDEALTWIRESVRRDPQENQGAEWVHVKILEAKVALKRDPHWLRKNSVIGWREGQRMPLDERSQPRSARKLVDA